MQHSQFQSIPASVYSNGETLQKEVMNDLRSQHFTLGDCYSPDVVQSTSQASYVEHAGTHKAMLAQEVQADLRASHFSIGGKSEPSDWVSTSRCAFADPCVKVSRVERRGSDAPAGYTGSVLPFEDVTDYTSESRRALPLHWGIHRTEMAKEVKADLRRSHFSHTGSGNDDYSTTASSAYTYRPQSGDSGREAMKQMKAELTRSHFNLWEGSMKGYLSESKAQYSRPSS